MRKKKIIIVVSLTITLVLLGTLGMKKIMEPTEKEKQIAFLKDEEKLSKYIKQESHSEIEIKYDWKSVEHSQSMAFSRPTLAIKFDVIDKKKSSAENYYNKGNTLVIDVNNEYSAINDMWTTNDILE
ncbi:hypothetical protein JZO83_03135 [Enterococcus sp. DIV1298c]|uniref:Uncharacterized protein n=1 Tax=Candidatus Enterococcus mangumiae TaxID=2230878 RepID=A0ABZ2SS86_9ENTE|nr:hypothetical protein [Enterococcus sp. DIV1298c]MBO0488797.1 hypothetical protein [Enterococcus sp. DIV1094]